MKFKPSISKRSWIVIATLIIVGILFGIYFGIYIPNRVNHITAEKFRQINNIAENISDDYFNQFKQSALAISESIYLKSLVRDSTTIWLARSVERYLSLWQQEGKFDEIILMSNNEVIYQSTSNETSVDSDSAIMKSHGVLKSTNMTQVMISQQLLNAFTTHFSIPGINGLLGDGNDFYLVGLVSKEKFDKMSRSVPRWYLIQASIILLILMMSMPWIKLVSMNEMERLYRSNIIWLSVASIFGVGMIVLIYSAQYARLKSLDSIEETLVNISDEIGTRFLAELDVKISALHALDDRTWQFEAEDIEVSLVPDSQLVNAQVFKVNADKVSDSITLVSGFASQIYNSIPELVNWQSLLWMDAEGYARNVFFPKRISATEKISPLLLKDRRYFQAIKSREFWYLNNKPFVLESIRSWKDQSIEAMISIPTRLSHECQNRSTPLTAAAMGSKFSSVMNHVMLPGYSFAIIDPEGNVLFHSNTKKNLQENILNESKNNRILRSAIEGRTQRTFRMMYQDRYYQNYARPVAELPLILVTSFDLTYDYLPITQVIYIVFVLLLLLLLLLVIQCGILYFLRYKPDQLKKRGFILDFLTPSHGDNGIIVVNLFLIGLLLLLITISIVTYYASLVFTYSLAPIFIIFITKVYAFEAIHRSLEDSEDRVVHRFRLFSYAFIVLLNIFYFYYFRMHILYVLGFQVLIFCTIEYFIFKRAALEKLCRDSDSGIIRVLNKHITLYVLLLLFLSVSSIHFCYKFADQTENLLWTKYSQVEAAKAYESIQEQLTRDADTYRPLFNDSNSYTLFQSQFVQPAIYFADKVIHTQAPQYLHPLTDVKFGQCAEKALTQEIHESLVLGTHPLLAKVHAYVDDNSSDGSFYWGVDDHDLQNLYLRYQYNSGKEEYFLSVLTDRSGSMSLRAWLTLAILMTIIGLYYLMSYAGRKIYAPAFKNYVTPKEIDLSFLKDCRNGRIFLIDMPYSTTRDVMRKYTTSLKDRGIHYGSLSFKDIEKPIFSKLLNEVVRHRQVIILGDFGYRANNHMVWSRKLDVLEDLSQDSDKQIIIVSETHPHMVVKFYETMISKIYDKQWSPQFRDEYQSYRHAKSQWQQFFTGFVKIYEPLREDEEFSTVVNFCDKEIIATINDELRHGTYLPTLDPLLNTYCRSLKEKNEKVYQDDIILKVQSLAELYYYSIWSTLSRDEKFLVYDLAIDGFVNTKNGLAIRVLMQKGLLKWDRGFRLMNDSFNNFILTVVDKEMDRTMRKEMLSKGSWSVLQLVILIIMISIGIFILLGNQHLITNIQAGLTAMVAVGGLLLRFQGILGSFSSSRQPS